MTLKFDPSPYAQAFQQGQQNKKADRDQYFNSIGGIAENMLKYKQQSAAMEQQNLMKQLLMKKEGRDAMEHSVKYGNPQAIPYEESNFQTPGGQNPLSMFGPKQTQGSFLDQFSKFRQGPKVTPQNEWSPMDKMNVYGTERMSALSKRDDEMYDRGFKERQLTSNEGLRLATLDLATRKEDTKDADAKNKAQTEINSRKDRANLVIGKVDQVLSKLNGLNTGGMADTKDIPFIGQFTGATNINADLETIKANLGFDQMSEMRAQSKAGATGLGALSEKEMSLLVSARANLDQAQDEQQLRERLGEVKTHLNNWLKMEEGINPYANKNPGSPGSTSVDGDLIWNGRTIKDTPANRAWLSQQKGVSE